MSNNQVNFDFKNNVDNGSYLLGENVAKNDLLQADLINAKAYKINYLDYAVCGNVTYGTAQSSFDTGRMITDTSLPGASAFANSEFLRSGLILHSSNNLFVISITAGGLGLTLSKFNKAGELRSTIAVDTTYACNNTHLLELSNGSILLVYSLNSVLKFVIYDEDFNIIKTNTTISNVTSDYFSACLLSGGGFAVVYQDSSNALLNKLTTYDNTGTVVTAATTIWTRVGTSGDQYHRMLQLSNGNLAIAVNSKNTTGTNSIGLFYGIFTTAAAAVLAFTNIKTASSPTTSPILSVSSSGYFCVVKSFSADGLYAYIYNNAGVLQGSNFFSSTNAITSSKKIKLLTDNTDFYLLWSDSNISKLCLTKLPTTGTNFLTTYVTFSSSNYNYYIDAFIENNAICYVSNPGSGAGVTVQMGVIKLSNRKLISTLGTSVGNSANITGEMVLIPLGERIFGLTYNDTNASSVRFVAGKYAQTAILGISKSTKSIGDYADIYMMPGVYKINLINTLSSSLSKSFNHAAYNFVGNKGSINGYSVYLQGMAV